MKIAIIGGGITGLTAAYILGRSGHSVTVYEREPYLGGLAYGFKEKNWNWHLEGAYHHLFTNDRAIIDLSKELGIGDKLMYTRPITANLLPSGMYGNGAQKKSDQLNIAQLDSPVHLLKFPGLSIVDKLRTGAVVAFCKLFPFWQILENTTAQKFFSFWGGKNAWNIIWNPLMSGKFGSYSDSVAASWLWARIHKRTPSLVYFKGGFQTFITALSDAVIRNGGTILTRTDIDSVRNSPDNSSTVTWRKNTGSGKSPAHESSFDRLLFTTPTSVAQRLMPILKKDNTGNIPHLHAQVLILESKEPVLLDTYWLSVTDRTYPFLAVVAHTNFMDKKHYGNNHITYLGNYLPEGHPYLKMTKEQLLNTFMPYIHRITQNRNIGIRNSYLFTGLYAQPVHGIRYSVRAPKLHTSVPGVYIANMDSIYPWDRGTNYAVASGLNAAEALASET